MDQDELDKRIADGAREEFAISLAALPAGIRTGLNRDVAEEWFHRGYCAGGLKAMSELLKEYNNMVDKHLHRGGDKDE